MACSSIHGDDRHVTAGDQMACLSIHGDDRHVTAGDQMACLSIHGDEGVVPQERSSPTQSDASCVDIISKLPVELLRSHILPRLNESDFVALSHVSTAYRSNFTPWREPLCLRQHFGRRFVAEEDFRRTVLNSLHPALRLHITLKQDSCEFWQRLPNCDGVSQSLRIHSMDLSFTSVRNVSALSGVHTLNLRHTCVTDVSSLGRVYSLDLSNTQVAAVSALGGMRTLDLSQTNVHDVSCLGHVHTLSL
eukprot:Opistho-2@39569